MIFSAERCGLLEVVCPSSGTIVRYPMAKALRTAVSTLVAVLIMLVTGWLGWEMVYRRRVGIADEGM